MLSFGHFPNEGGGVVVLAENKANSAQLELEAGAELGKNPQFFSVRSSLSKDSQWTITISCVATTAFSQKISEPNPRIPESPELFPGLS